MRRSKIRKSIIAVLAMVLSLALLTACGESAKDKAIDKIKDVTVSDYMEEDQDTIKNLKKEYQDKIEKAKGEDKIEDVLNDFDEEIAQVATREDILKAFKDLLNKQVKGTKKEEKAKDLIASYEDKIDACKSNKELDKIAKELNKKLTDLTGKTVEISSKNAEKTTVKTSSRSTASKSSGTKKTATSSTSVKKHTSSSSHASSSSHKNTSTTSAKKKVWVVDTPAHTETRYKTETVYVTKYKCGHGYIFDDYEAAYAHYEQAGEAGDPCGFNAFDMPVQQRVPYTVTIPAKGHWEYR